jgi:lysophospholipase L1-like esterase
MRLPRAPLSLLLCGIALALPVTPVQAQVQAQPAVQQNKLPFEAEILAYEAADRMSPPDPGGVLFIGSSSIRLWSTLTQDFPELPVLNRGFGGSVIADSIRYTPRIVLPYKPRMIVFYAGSNDISKGLTPEQVRTQFATFVDGVRGTLPDTRIVFVSINPSVSRLSQRERVVEANHRVEDYVREQSGRGWKLNYLDSYSKLLSSDGMPRPEILRKDGLHLNADGYALWRTVLKPEILELWAKDKH